MADQLYLSYWLKNFNPLSMPRQFEKLLQTFPFSRLNKREAVMRIYAVAFSEPPLIETPVPQPVEPSDVIAMTREFPGADCCWELTAAWDLWVSEDDWKLGPAAVRLSCFGPEFDTEAGEHIRVDFGLEDQFLPVVDMPDSLPMIRANIQSLLRLVHDLDDRLDPEKRLLWSESGGNFAERLRESLGGGAS